MNKPMSQATKDKIRLAHLNRSKPKVDPYESTRKTYEAELGDRNGEILVLYKCQDCDEFNEEEGPQLYECGECGSVFNKDNGQGHGHICPDCGKFGSRKEDYSGKSCLECEVGEVEELLGIKCGECDQKFEGIEEFIEHYDEEHKSE